MHRETRTRSAALSVRLKFSGLRTGHASAADVGVAAAIFIIKRIFLIFVPIFASHPPTSL
jgi:hypothetical protein